MNDPLCKANLKYLYHGSSMRSTFTPGQVLSVRPNLAKMRQGDVVVYRKDHHYIVHRVIALHSEGISARGDDNHQEDPGMIPFRDIVGVVEGAELANSFRGVSGGRRGLMSARLRWSLTAFLHALRLYLGAPYRWLKARRWMGRIWRPKIQALHLLFPRGASVKYILRGKVIATWQPDQKRFTCLKPFDLILFPPDFPS